MSVTFPINLSLVDTNGDGAVDAAQITQTIADELYSYYVSKLQNDTTFLDAVTSYVANKLENDNSFAEGLVNTLVNDETAFNTLYSKIKEKLQSDVLTVFVKVPYEGTVNALNANAMFAQMFNLVAAMMPLALLSSLVNQGNTMDKLLEAVVPLLILVPLLSKI